jgi:hypothetical protein
MMDMSPAFHPVPAIRCPGQRSHPASKDGASQADFGGAQLALVPTKDAGGELPLSGHLTRVRGTAAF